MDNLAAIGIGKSYEGNAALRDVSFRVERGTVLAVCGENGAGKSTLMKILSGATTPDTGTLSIDGEDVTLNDPREAIDRGIATVHQELSLLPHLSIAENMLLGKAPRGRFRWQVDWREMYRLADEVLRDLGVETIDVRQKVSTLSVSVQQVVEIAKALVGRPQVLILDEPTAVLSAHEAELLFRAVRKLARLGTIIIYISHRLEEIFEISDQVLVLKDGEKVMEAATGALDRDALIRAMVGRPLTAIYPARRARPGPVLLECRHLARRTVFRDVSFSLRGGEVVGMFGLVGSGRTDLARALSGATPADAGEIWIAGEKARIASPREAVRHGIAFVTEDRKRDGLALDLDLMDNAGLATMGDAARLGVLDRRRRAAIVGAKLDDLAVRPKGTSRPVRQLSGGNQQKVVLAKWLLVNGTRIFLFDEPTRGVDIATKVEIYRMVAALADAGMAILLISSELPEILGMSDRVLIMRGGSLVADLPRAEMSMETVFARAAGIAADRISA
ncbi:MAG TPA: sugar ABC transporter ATP-binding protein [Dongiaceae bacterium]|nr:sugar ABC transporter ATP-binding protein [Dongiaceae bacterium]